MTDTSRAPSLSHCRVSLSGVVAALSILFNVVPRRVPQTHRGVRLGLAAPYRQARRPGEQSGAERWLGAMAPGMP